MAGLPCTVAAILVLALLGTAEAAFKCDAGTPPIMKLTPEKCLNTIETGSDMSNDERRATVERVNWFRANLANKCEIFEFGPSEFATHLRKIHYNCELEKSAKFDCSSATASFETDDKFLRFFKNAKGDAERTAIFDRELPVLSGLELDEEGVLQRDGGHDLFIFSMNKDATEVGCFLKKCDDKEYMACATDVPLDWTQPLYTPGNRCQKNADCTEVGHPVCDMDYGLCDKAETPASTTTASTTTPSTTASTTTPSTKKPTQGCQSDADCTTPTKPVCNRQSGVCGPSPSTSTLTCKFSDSSLTGDACKDLRACTEATDKTEPEKQFCRSTVIIAEKNSDNSYTVKGFGSAVGEKHLLSSVTSDFTKFGNTELYAIAGGTTVYQLRAENVIPYIYIGDPNFDAWGDLALVELPAPLKFNDFLKIKKVDPQDKSLTLQMAADKIIIKDMSLKPDAECQKMFSLYSAITYVPNKNMACGLDDNDKATGYLSGVPLADMALTDGKHTLHGIRSIESLDPQHSNGFLVTKLAPNCDWLSIYSGGAVKCV